MLVWKLGVPCQGEVYYQTAPGWIMARSRVRGVFQYVLWRGKRRYPADGHGYASADEAKAVANNEDTK